MRAHGIPAQAGTQSHTDKRRFATLSCERWVPACAGMTR